MPILLERQPTENLQVPVFDEESPQNGRIQDLATKYYAAILNQFYQKNIEPENSTVSDATGLLTPKTTKTQNALKMKIKSIFKDSSQGNCPFTDRDFNSLIDAIPDQDKLITALGTLKAKHHNLPSWDVETALVSSVAEPLSIHWTLSALFLGLTGVVGFSFFMTNLNGSEESTDTFAHQTKYFSSAVSCLINIIITQMVLNDRFAESINFSKAKVQELRSFSWKASDAGQSFMSLLITYGVLQLGIPSAASLIATVNKAFADQDMDDKLGLGTMHLIKIINDIIAIAFVVADLTVLVRSYTDAWGLTAGNNKVRHDWGLIHQTLSNNKHPHYLTLRAAIGSAIQSGELPHNLKELANYPKDESSKLAANWVKAYQLEPTWTAWAAQAFNPKSIDFWLTAVNIFFCVSLCFGQSTGVADTYKDLAEDEKTDFSQYASLAHTFNAVREAFATQTFGFICNFVTQVPLYFPLLQIVLRTLALEWVPNVLTVGCLTTAGVSNKLGFESFSQKLVTTLNHYHPHHQPLGSESLTLLWHATLSALTYLTLYTTLAMSKLEPKLSGYGPLTDTAEFFNAWPFLMCSFLINLSVEDKLKYLAEKVVSGGKAALTFCSRRANSIAAAAPGLGIQADDELSAEA